MLSKRINFYNEYEESLSGIIQIPDIDEKFPAVIICHDFNENKDRELMFDLGTQLAHFRFVTLRFDFLHHGESEGQAGKTTVTQQIEDLKAAIDFLSELEQVDPEKIAVIGHGLGGIISMLAAKQDERIKALITIGTRSHLQEFFDSYFRPEEQAQWQKDGFFEFHHGIKLHHDMLKDSEDHDVEEALKELKIPILAVNGTNDKRTPDANARTIYLLAEKSPIKNLEIVEAADHSFTGDHRQPMIEVCADWLVRMFQNL
ncbi:alpha/beta hydrolase [Nanoarchaeota archaeon]